MRARVGDRDGGQGWCEGSRRHTHGVGESLGEEDEVELLDLALEGLEAAAHLGEHVRLLAPLEHERAVGRRADALGRTW